MTKSKGKAKAKVAHKGPQQVISLGTKRKRAPKGKESVGGFTTRSGIGSRIGSALGGLAQKVFSSVTGVGAYDVKKNSLSSGRPPMFQSRSGADGSIEFMHSEFLNDVQGSVAFTNNNYNLNVGLVSTFPFLANIAANFEQYELHGMMFEFRSTSASALNSTNTALGVVIMSTDYDVLDANFTSKQQMEAYMFTTSSSPAESMLHPIECAKRSLVLDNLYVRTGAIPTLADQRFYDVGNFQIATVGMQAAATIGELWVTYHVKLLKPKLQTPLGGDLQGAHLLEQPLGTATAAAVFGTAPNSTGRGKPGTNLDLGANYAANVLVIEHVGRFIMDIQYESNQVITAVPSIAVGSNLVVVNFFNGGSISYRNMFESAGVTRKAMSTVVFDCIHATGTSANYVTITGPAGMLTGSTDVIIQQISSALTVERFGVDSQRGAVLDKILERLSLLEKPDPMIKRITDERENLQKRGSETDDDIVSVSSSSIYPVKQSKNFLTDSVVNLIAEKLRK